MSKTTKTVVALSIAGVAALLAAPAAVAEKGDWIIRGGATMVDPKSNNLSLGDINDVDDNIIATDGKLQVDDATSFGFNVTYMMTDNLGIELLAAYPFTHDVNLCFTAGGQRTCGKLAEVDHLPPTLSLQWRFMPDSTFQPYVGAGINFTLFSDEKFSSDLQPVLDLIGLGDADLTLDDSTGIAVQIGADWFFNESWLINADIRYIEIQPDLEVSAGGESDKVGKVKIDPMVYSLMIGYRF
jgi:outer membrane protein